MPKLFVELLTKAAGNAGLRSGQLAELLENVNRCGSDLPVIMAGDLYFHLSEEPATPLLTGASLVGAPFENPFDNGKLGATTTRSRLGSARAIEWILTRGPFDYVGLELHDSVRASDHYPLPLVLKSN